VVFLNISSTSNSGSNTTDYSRLTGLATGLDTDGLVKQALAGDQTKIDQIKKDTQYIQWQQEAYVGFIKDLKDFNDNFDIIKPDNMMLSGAYTGTTASGALSNGSDADDYLTASTLPGAIKGNYQIQISNLAEGAKSQSGLGSISFTPPADASGLSGKIVLDIANVGQKTIDLSGYTKGTSVDQIVSDIQSKLTKDGSITGDIDISKDISVKNENGKIVITSISGNNAAVNNGTTLNEVSGFSGRTISSGFTSSTTLGSLGVTGSDSFTIKINGTKTFTINISSTDKVSDLVDKLKSANNGTDNLLSYVNISFSDLTNKLSIETKDTGTANTMEIQSTSNTKILGIAGTYAGKDANISIKAPGESNFVQVTKGSNAFTIDNIKYNLLTATSDTINLNVKSDASAQVDKFKKFIDKYNEIIDKINTKINEKRNYDYKPLTDTQKSSMKDTEITAWETKAKEGILARDNYLTNIVSQMRQAVYDTVKSSGISVTEVGITTTSNFKDGGKLVLDETKLKSALEQRGDLVQKLFTNSDSAYENKGIFQRFKDIINNATGTDGTLVKKAGYTNTRWVSENQLSKSIAEKNAKIKDMQAAMKEKQQRLYSMYATLEQNMNNINSQSSWLTSQLSG
jgi:flagellar hook-associated protein 2